MLFIVSRLPQTQTFMRPLADRHETPGPQEALAPRQALPARRITHPRSLQRWQAPVQTRGAAPSMRAWTQV
ncbi:MAG: hypothetical protein JSS18_00720 [Proteobacteria bacterium]|nr:hypothetical protein [Pseudomonadota bacterium]